MGSVSDDWPPLEWEVTLHDLIAAPTRQEALEKGRFAARARQALGSTTSTARVSWRCQQAHERALRAVAPSNMFHCSHKSTRFFPRAYRSSTGIIFHIEIEPTQIEGGKQLDDPETVRGLGRALQPVVDRQSAWVLDLFGRPMRLKVRANQCTPSSVGPFLAQVQAAARQYWDNRGA